MASNFSKTDCQSCLSNTNKSGSQTRQSEESFYIVRPSFFKPVRWTVNTCVLTFTRIYFSRFGIYMCLNHRHLSNIDCLVACTAFLVCLISIVNSHSKKEEKKPIKTGTSSRHITNVKQSIFETFDIYGLNIMKYTEQSVCPSVCRSVYCPSVCPTIRQSICLSVWTLQCEAIFKEIYRYIVTKQSIIYQKKLLTYWKNQDIKKLLS
jgi:hypothetical protein